MAKDKEITCDVLLTLSEKAARGEITRLQIVKWNNGNPRIEKRGFYVPDGDTVEKCTKAKGLDSADFDLLMTKADEVRVFLAVVK